MMIAACAREKSATAGLSGSEAGVAARFWYDYDAANNRTRMRREGAGGAETESAYYWYDAANGMTERRVYTPGSGWVDTYYYYDLNGGRTALVEGGEATYYAYGPHGFPTRIKPPNEAATYFYYDGKLNRYCIDLAGTPTYFLWEGLNLLEERNADGSLKVRYTHGYTPIEGIGSIVEAERHTATATYFQYLHMDHRGTVYAVTDANENIQIDYTLDAFGRELASPGGSDPNVPNDQIYQTNWRTVKIGGREYQLSPSRTRDPLDGQFLQRDPLPSLIRVVSHTVGNAFGSFYRTVFGEEIIRLLKNRDILPSSLLELEAVDPIGVFSHFYRRLHSSASLWNALFVDPASFDGIGNVYDYVDAAATDLVDPAGLGPVAGCSFSRRVGLMVPGLRSRHVRSNFYCRFFCKCVHPKGDPEEVLVDTGPWRGQYTKKSQTRFCNRPTQLPMAEKLAEKRCPDEECPPEPKPLPIPAPDPLLFLLGLLAGAGALILAKNPAAGRLAYGSVLALGVAASAAGAEEEAKGTRKAKPVKPPIPTYHEFIRKYERQPGLPGDIWKDPITGRPHAGG